MFSKRRIPPPRLLFLTLSAALLCTTLNTVHAAPTSTCTLTDLHQTIDEWRSGKAPLIEGYKALGDLLFNFEIIESKLATQCDGIKDHLTRVEHVLKVFQPAGQIPPLKGLIKPVQKIGDRLNIAVLKKPEQTVCKTFINIRNRVKNIAPKFKNIRDKKISKLLKGLDGTHEAVKDALQKYQNAGGNPTNCIPLFQLCAAAREALDLQRAVSKEIKDLLAKSKALEEFLEKVENGVKKTTDFIDKVFDGAVGEVLGGVSKLLNKKISLPIPRGAKERGVGVIPNCCPRGYSMQGGLCYKNCRSGYAPVLFTCVERCRRGWKDIGVTCTRTVWKKVGFIKVPVPVFDAKHSYGRGIGRIPATFGNAACSCRREKKYLEAGLCYNKCGRDHLSGYKTSFLTQCLDLRSTTLTILDLAKHLNIFKQAEKIPVLGSAIKAVTKTIDQAFAALAGKITDALKVPAPPLDFPTTLKTFLQLDKIGDSVDLGILNKIDSLTDALLSATSCRNTL